MRASAGVRGSRTRISRENPRTDNPEAVIALLISSLLSLAALDGWHDVMGLKLRLPTRVDRVPRAQELSKRST